MAYQEGDTSPPHINVHNEVVSKLAEISAEYDLDLVLPPQRNIGDTEHVKDHNLITDALQAIDDWEAAGGGAPGAAVIGDATGAVTKSSFTENGQAFDVYEFTGSGELVVSDPGVVDALLVGGGGGAKATAGGAGAGGCSLVPNFYISNDTPIKIVVGAGAPRHQFATTAPPRQGGPSRFGLLTAAGGAGSAEAGPSGGGGLWKGGIGGAGFYPIGNSGGNGAYDGSGGGGGAETAGQDGNSSKAGDGGAGRDVSFMVGNPMVVAGGGGGGGGGSAAGGAGGDGGGGAGGGGVTNGSDGEQNTGGGGGGGGSNYVNAGGDGGAGGSGIVIVRVKVASESYPFRSETTAPRTAHAARIEDGIVRQVIVIPHLDDDDAKITEYCNRIGLAGSWVDTSYTGSRRGKYAGVGDTFVSTKAGGEFISPVTEEISTTDLPGDEQ